MQAQTTGVTPIPLFSQDFQFPRKRYVEPTLLSTFQKILLTNNGTITDLVEIYAGEPIKVKKLTEEVTQLNWEILSMQLELGSSIIDRKILLQGGISGRNYIYAESIIALERLDKRMRHELLKTKKPIGKIWLENKVEIFKENFETGKEPARELANYFDIDPEDNLLFRTYGVLSNRKYTMMITEKFPESYFNRAF
ncbi:chorismate pyruvate-lyase family protein [Pannus brasiliensis CCIBt3594]|uniref:Chorismate pyruvate-lyase family protein n=1 Tax=Pannus brasiliensis CCIBt3594 TaxID=1427578 RepID=A0AAW9R0V2_9CHRO